MLYNSIQSNPIEDNLDFRVLFVHQVHICIYAIICAVLFLYVYDVS